VPPTHPAPLVRRTALGLALALVTACGAPDPDATSSFELDVPSGASASSLTGQLVDKGLVSSAFTWKVYVRLHDASCIKAGRHEVSPRMSIPELLDALCSTPLPEDEPFTVPEGWRARDIDAALADRGWLPAGAYLAVVEHKAVPAPFEVSGPTYEGYLFPETYMVVPKELTAEGLVTRQLDTFQARFLAAHPDLGKRSLHDVVVMASLVEREEPSPANRPVVAGVLWKRLDHAWNLGCDATSRYTLAQWNDRDAFMVQLRNPGDVYNTRLRPGLPPTAIGNPGLASLEAALSPVETEWWYYLHDGTGQFHGAKDKAGHEANRRTFNVY
jgi:UPF0755 protein